MLAPRCRFLRAGLVAATALLFLTLVDRFPFLPLEAESYDADSGEGIYCDTRGYRYFDLLAAEADSGDGIYSDTSAWAGAVAIDGYGYVDDWDGADSGDGVYSDTSDWDGADSGDGVYSDTSDWDGADSGDSVYSDTSDWGDESDDAVYADSSESGQSFENASSDPAVETDSGTADVAGDTDYWSESDSEAVDDDLADSESSDDDLLSLFEDAEDSEGVESAPVLTAPAATNSNEKKIDWWGHLSAGGGLMFKMFPDGSMSPFATLSNTLGFTAKPFDDMVVRGGFYSEFPAFNFELTTLYFDYIMNDKLYITAGKTGTAWGISQIFDTNILDDEGDGTVVNPYADETDTGNRFDVIATLPIWKGEIQGVGMYAIGDEMSRDNLSFAGKVQYPIGPVSLELFARKWATSDTYWMEPAAGMSLTTDIFGNHVFAWGKAHFNPDDPLDLSTAKGVVGISRLITSDAYGKFGIAAEYQLTYNFDNEADDRMNHDVALSLGWSHAMGSDFSPVIRWWYNPISKQGYILPSLTYTGLRHMDITLTVPYIFGGATYTYGNVSWSSTVDEPLVMFGLVFSLSVPY